MHVGVLVRYQIEQEVARWVTTMGLSEYASKLSGTYSGGNKRKLSTAMALIGEPNLVVLDEPTSGVDPISRRKLWDILIEARKRGEQISKFIIRQFLLAQIK